MSRTDADFTVDGVRCAAWHYAPGGADGDAACVVMTHGLGGTRDSGLEPYAERLAGEGHHVLLYDPRCLGASDGEPRGLITLARQVEDMHAAVAHARALPGVDAGRIVLWGASLAGGHVLRVAAEDARVAAVIALIPATDGVAVLRGSMKANGPLAGRRLMAAAARDLAAAARGAAPVKVPLVGPAGSDAVLTAPGAEAAYAAVAGPTWRNEVCARFALEIPKLRAGRYAAQLRCPLLVQVSDLDQTVPPASMMDAAWQATGRAQVRHYPCDHFDVFGDGAWTARAAEHQVQFLASVLAPQDDREAAAVS